MKPGIDGWLVGLGRRAEWLVLAVTAAGCWQSHPSSSGFPACIATDTQQLSRDEVSPLGVSAADILAFSEGEFSSTMGWGDGTESPLSLRVAYAEGAIIYRQRQLGHTLEGRACTGTLAIQIDLGISTEDNRLELSSTDELTIDADSNWAEINLELPDSFDARPVVPGGDRYASIRCLLNVRFTPHIVSGNILGVPAQSEPDSAPESTTPAFMVGHF
jgi:hypothetical protein